MNKIIVFMFFTLAEAFAQPYNVRPNQAVAWSISCYVVGSNVPVANCPITVSTGVVNNSGGHFHNSNRPKSQTGTSPTGPWSDQAITNLYTGPNGTTTMYTRASPVGQQETLVSCPQMQNGVCQTTSVLVRFSDIYYVEEKPEWNHIGATGIHGSSNAYNHWMVGAVAYNVWYAVRDYLAAHPEQVKVDVNDMALPYGGIFDLGGNWAGPHSDHSRGTAVDIRANGLVSTSIPVAYAQQMVDYCLAWGSLPGSANSGVHSPGGDNAHVHCRWPDPV